MVGRKRWLEGIGTILVTYRGTHPRYLASISTGWINIATMNRSLVSNSIVLASWGLACMRICVLDNLLLTNKYYQLCFNSVKKKKKILGNICVYFRIFCQIQFWTLNVRTVEASSLYVILCGNFILYTVNIFEHLVIAQTSISSLIESFL